MKLKLFKAYFWGNKRIPYISISLKFKSNKEIRLAFNVNPCFKDHLLYRKHYRQHVWHIGIYNWIFFSYVYHPLDLKQTTGIIPAIWAAFKVTLSCLWGNGAKRKY